MTAGRPSPAGLYVHLPFCVRKCRYCDFYSLPMDEQLADTYLSALQRQIAEMHGVSVDTVYFGGGTPSLFGAARIAALLDAIAAHFTIIPGAEITLEANPDSITPQDLRAWQAAGVNRLSVGVQSLDDDELQWLGRLHSADAAHQAVLQAHESGFDNISIDLLYGLPSQQPENWRHTLETVATWPVTHISGYGLNVEHNMPLATDDAFAAQYLAMTETLPRLGFEQYEISNFARTRCQSRHNLKYWTLRPYIGIGASAHGDFGGERTAIVSDIHKYIRGGDIYELRQAITPQEREREAVMLGLRLGKGIADKRLAAWQQHGLTEYVDGRWRLTPKGMLVSNRLIGELLGG